MRSCPGPVLEGFETNSRQRLYPYLWSLPSALSTPSTGLRTGLGVGVLVAALRLYQVMISPLLGPACRFYPSCSAYALEAVKYHGAMKGMALALLRLLRCHPWHPGGVDPVPVRKGKRQKAEIAVRVSLWKSEAS